MLLVTGGAGFIGSNLIAQLNEGGRSDIVVSDELGAGEKWRNLAKRKLADVVPPSELMAWLEGRKLEAVLHLGAISDTTASDADLVIETNFRLSLRLLDWCAGSRTPFIYASSAATYGDGSNGFDDDWSIDALARLRPMNLYGWSKHLFDQVVAVRYGNGGKLPPQWAGLKFFNVYGPNEAHKGDMQSVVSKIRPLVKAGSPIHLFRSHNPSYADGGQLRDFVYVKDCVAAVMWLLRNPVVNGLFNVGSGTARSFVDLVKAVGAAVGHEPDIRFIDTPVELRDKYQYFTQADMTKMRAAGFDHPFHSLEDGVRDYVRSLR